MPWVHELFNAERHDDHRYEQISFDQFQVLTKTGEDVTDDHISKIFANIRKANPVEAVAKTCKQMQVDMRESKSCAKTHA